MITVAQCDNFEKAEDSRNPGYPDNSTVICQF